MTHRQLIAVVVMLLLGFVLRVAGIAWGMPDPQFAPSFAPLGMINEQTPLHPDEFLFVALPYKMALTKTLRHGFYENPSLLLNINYILTKLTGADDGLSAQDRAGYNDRVWAPFSAYVVGRLLSVLGGVIGVAATFGLVRRLTSFYGACIAALLVAIAFPLVQHAHYSTTSSLAVGLMMLTMWTSAQALCVTHHPHRWLIASGICAGLALGLRYNVAFVSLWVLFAGIIMVWRQRNRQIWFAVLIAWLAFPLTFILTTPGIVFDTAKFVHDIRYISNQYIGAGSTPLTTSAWLGLALQIIYTIMAGAGLLAGIYALAGCLVGLRQTGTRRILVVLLLTVLGLHLLLINRTVRPGIADQLVLPLLPLLAIFTGIGMAYFMAGWGSWVKGLAVVLLIVQPVFMTLWFLPLVTTPDTRQLAQAWFSQRIPLGNRVLLVGSINVPLDPAFYTTEQIFDLPSRVPGEKFTQSDYLVTSDALPQRYANVGGGVLDEFVPPTAVKLVGFAPLEYPLLDSMVLSAHYLHQPGIVVYCLNASACDATIRER